MRIGIIGFSTGNGHPFSWSAIINGYNKIYLEKIPFKRIQDYLPKYNLPVECVRAAKVTSAWSDDKKKLKLLKNFANIKKVYAKNNLPSFAKSVDCIILARDDFLSRVRILKNLLKFKKPIFVDKLFHYNKKIIKNIFAEQAFKGQIMTGSALKFSSDIKLSYNEKSKIGKIIIIKAVVYEKWESYAIHIIDPIYSFFLKNKKIKQIKSFKKDNKKIVKVVTYDNLCIFFENRNRKKNNNNICEFEFIGTKSKIKKSWANVFYTFKSAIETFIYNSQNKLFFDEEDSVLEIARIYKTE